MPTATWGPAGRAWCRGARAPAAGSARSGPRRPRVRRPRRPPRRRWDRRRRPATGVPAGPACGRRPGRATRRAAGARRPRRRWRRRCAGAPPGWPRAASRDGRCGPGSRPRRLVRGGAGPGRGGGTDRGGLLGRGRRRRLGRGRSLGRRPRWPPGPPRGRAAGGRLGLRGDLSHRLGGLRPGGHLAHRADGGDLLLGRGRHAGDRLRGGGDRVGRRGRRQRAGEQADQDESQRCKQSSWMAAGHGDGDVPGAPGPGAYTGLTQRFASRNPVRRLPGGRREPPTPVQADRPPRGVTTPGPRSRRSRPSRNRRSASDSTSSSARS